MANVTRDSEYVRLIESAPIDDQGKSDDTKKDEKGDEPTKEDTRKGDPKVKEASSFEQMRGSVERAIQDKYDGMPDPDNDGDTDVDCYPGSDGRMCSNLNVVDTFPDRAVFTGGYGDGGSYFSVPYTTDDQGNVSVGNATQVERDYKSVKESVSGLKEAAGKLAGPVDPEGKEWDAVVIETGISKNGNFYSAKTLKEALPLIEGLGAFADHATDAELRTRPERSIRDKVGVYHDPEYGTWKVGDQLVEGIRAKLKIIAPWLRQTLLEAWKADEPTFFGVSIDADGKQKKSALAEAGGRVVNNVEKITKFRSADIVTDAAAGGKLVRLVAANRGNEGSDLIMDPKEIARIAAEAASNAVQNALREASKAGANVQEDKPAPPKTDGALALAPEIEEMRKEFAALKESTRVNMQASKIDLALAEAKGLSDVGKARVAKSLKESTQRRDLEDSEITQVISEAADYEARLLDPKFTNPGRLVPDGGYRPGRQFSSRDQMDLALRGLFRGEIQKDDKGEKVTPFRSLREAYCRWEGIDAFDVDPFLIHQGFFTKYDSHVDHKRIRESLSTATWGSVYADNLYIMMLEFYTNDRYSSEWKAVISETENVPDFQQRHWVALGGYNNLGIVPEQGTYPQIATPGNEQVNYHIQKRGGIDDVTFEAIVNDRFGAIRRIPLEMGRAAARTLWTFVFNMVTTDNPTMPYDSHALYDAANHLNANTNNLSLSGLQSNWTSMRSQIARLTSQEILGVRNVPKIIIVPTGLEMLARRIVNPSDAFLASLTAPTASGEIDPQAFKGMQLAVIVYDVLTSTTGWYTVADPAQVETLVIGFLNGQQDPELFVQDQPTVGGNFSSDKVSYKIRHIYGATIADHRSFCRGQV